MNLPRLLRTLAYLKPVQIYGRVLHQLPGRAPRLGPPPPVRAQSGQWVEPAEHAESLIGPTCIRLLNQEGGFATPADWNDPARDALWLYNLHYFDDLNAPCSASRADWHRAMLARWIAENPPGGGIGWDPYPTSLRIVNWIKWALGGAVLEPSWLASLAVQARWLEDRIEWRLLGNHLLANAKALIFAGAFFEGVEAERWLAKGLGLYRAQMAEQILADGGHFERTPMYQAILLEDPLDLINLGQATGAVPETDVAGWRRVASRMQAWLTAMTHPDGRISFFNDAAFGIAAEPAALDAYAGRLGLDAPAATDGLIDLRESGYIRLASGEACVLIDAAPIGPDYLPGHAHADTLSFEFSIGVDRVVVNGGTSRYGLGPERQRERATAAHSTVEIDGEDSSEVWAGFRVGRRARILERRIAQTSDELTVTAAHDGYRCRPGRPVHRRTWQLSPGRLGITDQIDGSASSAIARFHLAPGIEVSSEPGGQAGVLTMPSGGRIKWRASRPARVEPSAWRPQFGLVTESLQLAIDLDDRLETEFRWTA
jgi:uncharacterized heparinase superfamily protein